MEQRCALKPFYRRGKTKSPARHSSHESLDFSYLPYIKSVVIRSTTTEAGSSVDS